MYFSILLLTCTGIFFDPEYLRLPFTTGEWIPPVPTQPINVRDNNDQSHVVMVGPLTAPVRTAMPGSRLTVKSDVPLEASILLGTKENKKNKPGAGEGGGS